MSIQYGVTAITAQASFLQGGIAARYLPSADITPLAVRRDPYVRASGTQGIDCSINQHIPTCRFQTTDCTNGCPDPGTGSFCPTREFVC
ncbi:hypothetical protein AB0L53_57495 [Nonomuraea sp. NPDC052129]|uniref:hypothetical protein n=1 Tax=Nonomuraea sp. NPDC052129 TaxID=3154651 RepID=UPI00341211B5